MKQTTTSAKSNVKEFGFIQVNGQLNEKMGNDIKCPEE